MYNRYVPSTSGYTRIQENDFPFQPIIPDVSAFQPVIDPEITPDSVPTPADHAHPHTDEPEPTPNFAEKTEDAPPNKGWSDLIGDFKASSWLTDLLAACKLDSIDSGDILLLLILLFIFIEGDDLELVITLGLLLLFGLSKKDKDD